MKISLEYGENRAVKGIFITLRLRLEIHNYTYNMQILCKILYIKCYRFFMIVFHKISTGCVYIFWTEINSRQSDNYLISFICEKICLSLYYMVYYMCISYMVVFERLFSYPRKFRMDYKCIKVISLA